MLETSFSILCHYAINLAHVACLQRFMGFYDSFEHNYDTK